MINIIKPGKVHIAKCVHCECEFSFEKEDVMFGSQMDPGDFVKCPCCQKLVNVTWR